jgi:hypothetical protein
VNRVDGDVVGSVHVQLDVTRPRTGDLRLRREDIVADVLLPGSGEHIALPLSEAWTRRSRVSGDLIVPAWSRRPFDLFFDAPLLAESPPPDSVLLRWRGEAAGESVTGQCLFERIPQGDRRLPGAEPMKDPAFGMRGGYYLPGTVDFGKRALRSSTEERLHYIFHDPEAWSWW